MWIKNKKVNRKVNLLAILKLNTEGRKILKIRLERNGYNYENLIHFIGWCKQYESIK